MNAERFWVRATRLWFDRLRGSAPPTSDVATLWSETKYGSATFVYAVNGELQSKTDGAQLTTYQYDQVGNLMTVMLADGTSIAYLIDGRNRRIGKQVNDTLMQGFLYQDKLKPIAELDGGNSVVSRFVYATHNNVPDYMIKGGVTYRTDLKMIIKTPPIPLPDPLIRKK